MRKAIIITILSTGVLAHSNSLQRSLARAQSEMDKGLALVAKTEKLSGAKRKSTLRRAKSHLRTARIVAHVAARRATKLWGETQKQSIVELEHRATGTLVDLLNKETAEHLANGRRALARARNVEARRLAPTDARAKELKAKIDPPRRRDSEGKGSGEGTYGGSDGFNNRRRDLDNSLGLGHRNRARSGRGR